MRTHFKSRKDPLFGVVILGAALTLLVVSLTGLVNGKFEGAVDVFGLMLMVPAMVFMFWLWFDTHYRINDAFVYFRSGPFRGKIPVSSIREVVVGTTMWVGFKPALARNGVIVKYNRYDDIYFSPDNNDTFIDALLHINPEIRIVGRTDNGLVQS
ncbi:PH domain-containing protein [Parapedobacter sp. DT-150]|uniref:PH domain-containing protein n=1 Tax=Parapedobacter sp. DT-150 TaxID=3396162 RepID=UPI003F53E88C